MSGITPTSGNETKICFLVSESNPELKFILLDKVPFVLGRTKLTGITDLKLSKSQGKVFVPYPPLKVENDPMWQVYSRFKKKKYL
jgi:hypothetical protein